MRRMRRVRIAALCATCLAGCMTLDTRTNPSYDGPPAYSGTRLALGNFAAAFYAVNLPFMAFFLADGVLSGIADTLLLPVTFGEQRAWSAERARARRLDIEQPSPILPADRENPVTTAQRLFNTCNGLARNLIDRYTHCYSIEATVEIVEDGEVTRTLSGPEYKREILEAMEPMRGTARYVRYAEPTYEVEGPNVRVRAQRIDPEFDDPTSIEFLMGPGEDGGWRILGERSVGWK